MAAIAADHPKQVEVLNAVDPATATALTTHPVDAATRATALAQLSGLPPSDVRRVVALSRARNVPSGARAFLHENGPKVARAERQLRALSRVPPADLAFLVVNGPTVAEARKDNPGQRQTW